MKEVWKPVPYEPFGEKYVVSNHGRVKPIQKSIYSSLKSEFLTPGVGARGYAHVALYHNGVRKQFFVHRMVALAFIGDPPEGKNLVCHLDDNKTNNHWSNLMWGDCAENLRQMVDRGRSLRGSKVNTNKLAPNQVLEIREAHSKGAKMGDLARKYKVTHAAIWLIIKRKNWKYL